MVQNRSIAVSLLPRLARPASADCPGLRVTPTNQNIAAPRTPPKLMRFFLFIFPVSFSSVGTAHILTIGCCACQHGFMIFFDLRGCRVESKCCSCQH